MFNKDQFDVHFARNVARLGRVENMTKELLKNMSREVVFAVHETGDIGYVNKTLAVLTPVNRKVLVEFGREYTGFVYDDKVKEFTGKNAKKLYAKAKEAFDLAMEDPHFNIWSWAERNISVERKPVDLSKVTAYIKGLVKKADEDGISQSDLLKAIFAGGIDMDAVSDVLDAMANSDE